MRQPSPVSPPRVSRFETVFTLLLPMALVIWPAAPDAATITSDILIDPIGENNADFFGTSVAWIGDVNGDGYDDGIIGAFRYPELGSLGQAYVYFGGPGLDSVADLVIPAPVLPSMGWFGRSVTSAGDFNGDGYPDFIIGAPQAGYEGKAFVYYGGPSLDATPDVTLAGESTGSLIDFGAAVAAAGDVNGDGYDDVIVGAPQYRSGGNPSGRAYVYFGGAAPNAVADRVFTSLGTNDQLGTVVGCAGDINGDGHADVFASAPYYDTTLNAGAVHVWFGGSSFDAIPDLTVVGSGANQRFGSFAAGAGDVNNDGYSDLIVGEKDHAYVYFGGSSPNANADLTVACLWATVAGAGDVNSDGIDDFVVGAPYDGSAGVAAGRVSIFFGGDQVNAVEDLYFTGDQSGRHLGQCVAGGAHVDGPGPADVIVSAHEDPEAIGYNRGRVYVIANSFETTSVPPTQDGGVAFVGAQPNPAWNDVNLVLSLDHAVLVRITVYDLAGHEVARPVENEWLTGRVTRTWRPQGLPSGVYWVNARLGDRESVRKVALLGSRP